MKEISDWVKIFACCSAHHGLLKSVFMTRFEDVFMNKKACGTFRDSEIWGVISVSGDARTNWTNPGRRGIL
jgi:hypothetical protein